MPPRKNQMAVYSEPAIGLDIPRLPFLTGTTAKPACTDYIDTFSRAGDLDRSAINTHTARRSTKRSIVLARAICAACPVLEGCRTYALQTHQRWGVWGGTTAADRDEWAKDHPQTTRGTDTVPGKFDDVPTDPMFDDRPLRVPRQRPDPIVSAGQGNCPGCLKGKTGLIATNTHWVWRTHYYKTWGGDTRLCLTSGVALCVAPEKPGRELIPGHPVHCPHGPDVIPAVAA